MRKTISTSRNGGFSSVLILSVVCLVPPAQAQSSIPPANQKPTVPRNLTLSEAEALLLQRNLALAASRYQIEATRAARLLAGYKPNPVLTIGAQQFPFYSPASGSFPRFFSTSPNAAAQPTYTLHIDKTIERGGKRELRTAQADFQVKVAEALMMDVVRTELYQLRQAFILALLAKENLRLTETIDQQYQQTETLTQVRVENGDLAGAELYRIRAGRLQYQQAVLQAGTAYEQSTRDVLNLLGVRADEVSLSLSTESGEAASISKVSSVVSGGLQTSRFIQTAPLDISGSFDDRPVTQTLAELRQIALTQRPDVIAARNTLEAAERGLRLAEAQRKRDVIAGFEYQRVGEDHAIGVTLQIPLFTYNNQMAAIAQADAARREAASRVRQVELQAITDVEKAYQAYQSVRRTLDLYNTQNLYPVEKLHDISNYSYREGAASLLELLDSQRTYYQALAAHNQARADYQLSLWQLEQAIGRPLR